MDRVTYSVFKYYLYRSLQATGFIAPFLVIFLVGRGVSYTDLALGGTMMAVITIAGEVPTGYIGDRIGRRASILLGQTLSAIGTTGYLFARSTTMIVVLYSLFGLGIAFKSGSNSAWLYDLLGEDDKTDEFTKIESRASSLSRYTTAASMMVGALLFMYRPPVPFVFAAVANWVAVVMVYIFPRNVQYEEESDSAEPLSVRDAYSLTRNFLTNSAVRTLTILGSLYAGAMYTSSTYIQPAIQESIPQSSLLIAGIAIPEPIVLGSVYASFAAVSGFVVSYADELKQAIGIGKSIVIVYAIGAASMLIPAALPSLTLLAVIAFRALPPIAAPIRNGYLNDHASSVGRATLMSTVSFAFAITRVPILLLGGSVADMLSPTISMASIGALVLLLGGTVVIIDRPLTEPIPSASKEGGDAIDLPT